jgi:hypothetical protein
MRRVREVIPNIHYDELVVSNIVPDLNRIVSIENKRYPPLIYKNKNPQKFSVFGLFMEYSFRRILKTVDTFTFNKDFTQKVLIPSYKECDSDVFSDEDIIRLAPFVKKKMSALLDIWKTKKSLKGKILFETEYGSERDNFVGHPDIVVIKSEFSTVLDVKNTCGWKDYTQKEACLQVLSYYALMRKNNINVANVGFVFPMQEQIVMFRITEWDHEIYLNFVMDSTV